MKQIINLISLFILLSHSSFGQQGKKPFPYLNKIEVEAFQGTFLHFDKNGTTIINKRRKDLDKSDKFYAEECEGEYMTLIAKCKIDKNSTQYHAIVYSACPNPEFIIYDASDPTKTLATINAKDLYLNGTGNIYSSGGEGTFDVRKKYTLSENMIKQVVQPFYYVGITGKTLNPITLFQSKNLENKIAQLPANYDIEILLSEKAFNGTEALYLIKTAFGLTGWAKLKTGQYKPIDVQGLEYYGD